METETAATERRRRGRKRSDARRGCTPEKRKRPSDPVGFGDELRDDAGDTLAEMDETLLTEDERAYREARRRADEKVALSRELARAGLITAPLLLFLFPAGLVALIFVADMGINFRLPYKEPIKKGGATVKDPTKIAVKYLSSCSGSTSSRSSPSTS